MLKKKDWWQNLGETVTAPVGNLLRGAMRGIGPGLAEYNDLQKEAMRERYRTYGLRGIIDAIRTSGGDIEAAREIISDDPKIQQLITALDPMRGFTEEQKLQARLYGAGVKARPGAEPWETYGLEGEESLRDYAARLRHSKLQSSVPPWEREEYVPPTEKGSALDNIQPPPLRLPLPEVETEPEEIELPKRTPQAHTPQHQIEGPPSLYTTVGTPRFPQALSQEARSAISALSNTQKDTLNHIPEPKTKDEFKRGYDFIKDPEIAEAYFLKWVNKFK